jgi:hypothetical protein
MQEATARSYDTLGERIVYAARVALNAHLGHGTDGPAPDLGITGAEAPEDPDLGLDPGWVESGDAKRKNHPRRWAAGGAGQDGERPTEGTHVLQEAQPPPPAFAEERAV